MPPTLHCYEVWGGQFYCRALYVCIFVSYKLYDKGYKFFSAPPTPAEIVEKQPPTASVQVQAPTVPGTEEANPAVVAEPVAVQPPAGAVAQEEQDEADVFEDPTRPQALEGRLAGLEPIIGYPQMSLSEAVSAGRI